MKCKDKGSYEFESYSLDREDKETVGAQISFQ